MARLHSLVALALIGTLAPFSAIADEPGAELETPHLQRSFSSTRQSQIARRHPGWQRFVGRYAGFEAHFDERTGTPVRVFGSRIPLVDAGASADEVTAAADAFLRTINDLVAVPQDELTLERVAHVRGTWYLTYGRRLDGIEVVGAHVGLRLRDGAVTLIQIDTLPGARRALQGRRVITRAAAVADARRRLAAAGPVRADAGEEVVIGIPQGAGMAYRRAWRVYVVTRDVPGRWENVIDARTGELLSRRNLYRFATGTIRGRVEPVTVGDPMVDVPLVSLNVDIGGNSVSTDASGVYSVAGAGTAHLGLQGDYTKVHNDASGDADVTFDASVDPADYTVTGADADQAEIAAYVHTETIRAVARTVAPDLTWLDEPLTVNVNLPDVCNAYWDGESTNFFSELDGECNNVARVADVVYHEFGHGLHQHLLAGGVFDGAVSEGMADYFAVSITGVPELGRGFFPDPDTFLRTAENSKIYPQDLQYEVHADGEILLAAMWELRTALRSTHGDVDGTRLADRLAVDMLRGGPQLDDAYIEILLADDDDNDLSNGTPNQCAIHSAFAAHGLALGIVLTHVPPGGHFDIDEAVPVTASQSVAGGECVVASVSSMSLRYSVDDGESWSTVEMTSQGSDFVGEIPGQPNGSFVTYYMQGSSSESTATAPRDAPRNRYAYYVGERTPVFVDDFETDRGWTHGGAEDDWERGTPAGLGGDPTGAYSGSRSWGNDLNTDGRYGTYAQNWLESPEIDCTSCRNAHLQFRRWLQVEDGQYDRARVLINGEEVWSNAAGSGNDHRVDPHWTLQNIDIHDVADGQQIVIRFELETDQGLELGGWTLDDVGVYNLPVEKADDRGCACHVTPGADPQLFALMIALLAACSAVIRRRSALSSDRRSRSPGPQSGAAGRALPWRRR